MNEHHEPAPHWAAAYVGKPWQAGAAGPDAFDCWGLVREIYLARLGFTLPVVNVDAANVAACVREFRAHPERARWRQLDVWEPARELDAVLMSQSRHPHHIGVWLDVDSGGVLHAVEGAGVVFSDRRALAVAGWGRIEYFRQLPDLSD